MILNKQITNTAASFKNGMIYRHLLIFFKIYNFLKGSVSKNITLLIDIFHSENFSNGNVCLSNSMCMICYCSFILAATHTSGKASPDISGPAASKLLNMKTLFRNVVTIAN